MLKALSINIYTYIYTKTMNIGKKIETLLLSFSLLNYMLYEPVARAYCFRALPAISMSPSKSSRWWEIESGDFGGEWGEGGERGDTLPSGDGKRCAWGAGDEPSNCSANRERSTCLDILDEKQIHETSH